MSQLRDNLARVRERIADAAHHAGRSPESVRLVAVSKYVDAEQTRELFDAGCRDLGEARPQQLLTKAEALSDLPIRWHLIGHLQRNKARKIVELAPLIHSGDSLRLLEELNTLAAAQAKTLEILLEINISTDPTKHGFGPQEVAPLLPQLAALSHLRFIGLMAMSGFHSELDEARRQFEQVRLLRDHLASQQLPNFALRELSMGMTDDYPAAIAAGATMVRIGSALFDGIVV